MARCAGLGRGLLAGFVVLAWSAAAPGQIGSTGGTGGTSSSGGIGSGSRIGGTSGGTGTAGIGSMGLGGQTSTGGLGGMTSATGGTSGMGRTGSTSVLSPSNTNPFYVTYQNPMALGLSTTTSSTIGSGSSTTGTTGTGTTGSKSSATKTSATLGQPLFAATSTGARGQSSLTGGLGGISGLGGLGGTTNRGMTGMGGMGTTSTGSGTGFTTVGMLRNSPYATVLDQDTIRIEPPVIQPAELQTILDRSAAIPRKGTDVNGIAIQGVTVEVQGMVVVLRGEVGTARERRLAEGMVRLTPGVRQVDNQIVVMNQK